MKKLTILAALAITAFMSSCNAQSQKAQIDKDIDSLSYAIGTSRVEGLKEFMLSNGVDTTLMVQFLEGFHEGATNYEDSKLKARIFGMQIGQLAANDWVISLNNNIFGADSTMSINRELMLKGFTDALANNTDANPLALANAKKLVETKQKELKEMSLTKQYGENKAAGEQYLAENKSKEGVQTTASGLQYKVITEGNGEKPTASSEVRVHYRGTTVDGKEFDSSYARKEPAVFRVGQVIKGWQEALTLMPAGSKWEIYIPQELAYGTNSPSPEIKPFSALIFEVELIEIVK